LELEKRILSKVGFEGFVVRILNKCGKFVERLHTIIQNFEESA